MRLNRSLLILSLFLSAGGAGVLAAEHAPPSGSPGGTRAQQPPLPPDAEQAVARLDASPRHGEWVMIPSGTDSIRTWVVYPERATRAPVVVVIHEIYGLTNWVRAVTDQLAAQGFIAVAPDLLSGMDIPTDSTGDPVRNRVVAAIRTLDPAGIQQHLKDVAAWAINLPAATHRYGVVGFCWGGGVSFAHAVAAPDLSAAVVYYGTSPATADLRNVRAPVLGLYGGADARVDATIPPADSAMKAMGKTYQPHLFDGAGHGFLRQQTGRAGANMNASRQAWPLTIAWFRKYLEN